MYAQFCNGSAIVRRSFAQPCDTALALRLPFPGPTGRWNKKLAHHFQTSPRDPIVLGGVLLTMAVVGLLAACMPDATRAHAYFLAISIVNTPNPAIEKAAIRFIHT